MTINGKDTIERDLNTYIASYSNKFCRWLESLPIVMDHQLLHPNTHNFTKKHMRYVVHER